MFPTAAWVGSWVGTIINFVALAIGYTTVAIIAIIVVALLCKCLMSATESWRSRRRRKQTNSVSPSTPQGSGSSNVPAVQTPVGTMPRGTANISPNSRSIGIGYRLAFERLKDDEIAAIYTRFGLAVDCLKEAEKALCQGNSLKGYEHCKASLTVVQALTATDQRKHWLEAMVQLDLARLAHGADAETEAQQRYKAADEIIGCWQTELEWLRPILLRHRGKPVPA